MVVQTLWYTVMMVFTCMIWLLTWVSSSSTICNWWRCLNHTTRRDATWRVCVASTVLWLPVLRKRTLCEQSNLSIVNMQSKCLNLETPAIMKWTTSFWSTILPDKSMLYTKEILPIFMLSRKMSMLDLTTQPAFIFTL